MEKRILILGYGNIDRQDDGVAWHIIKQLMKDSGPSIEDETVDQIHPTGNNPQFLFVLQLTPELAETVANYDCVCFIDAHTGNIPTDIQMVPLTPHYQASAFTHHLTPATLIELSSSLYGKQPLCMLASVRGYQFGFANQLSEKTIILATQAAGLIQNWVNSLKTGDNLTTL